MPDSSLRLRGALLVLVAAALWGTLGTFYTWAREGFGLTPLTIVFWRAALAALALGAFYFGFWILDFGRRRRRVPKSKTQNPKSSDFALFGLFGLLGVTAFYLLYIYAVVLVGVAVAVVLLYTAPIFVALMAWRWLGEGFGARKVVALALTFVGCALVARAYNPALLQVNAVGILCGLGSAFTYALYSILGKVSLGRGYAIGTLSLWVYGIGAAGLLVVALFAGPGQLFAMGSSLEAWGLLLVLALAQTLGALWAYVAGLRHLEAGVASIIATFEPVVAALLAFFVLRETIEWPQVAGGALILGAGMIVVQSSRFKVPSTLGEP
jgi:drug/metabolite transporter, DME family